MTDDEVVVLIDRCRAEGKAFDELKAVRKAAKSFTTAETATALRAVAAAPFPGASSFMDRAASLVTTLVFGNPVPELVSVLREIMSALNPPGRAAAIRVAGQIGTADAFELMVDSLEAFLPDGGVRIDFSGVLYWLMRKPGHPELLFPRLLNLHEFPEVRSEVDDVVAAYLRAGLLSARDVVAAPDFLRSMLERFHAGCSSLATQAREAERAGDLGWWRNADYQQQRYELITVIDVVGFVDDAKIQHELEALATIADPRVCLAAITGLLRHGHAVPDQAIDSLATDPETRADLYDLLDGLATTARFPQKHYTQSAFAESRMYGWLSHGGELGRPADAIETMAAVELADSPTNSRALYFVTRFRSDGIDANGEEWLVGVFGPCHPSDPPEKISGLAFRGSADR